MTILELAEQHQARLLFATFPKYKHVPPILQPAKPLTWYEQFYKTHRKMYPNSITLNFK